MDTMSHNSIHTARPLRVIIIGAGPSGLLMGYKLKRNFINVQWKIYEKNPDVGGTWFENTYPGCRCDSPAHVYTWSFEQRATFPETYSSAREIWDYFKDFQKTHELQASTQTSCEVTGATWLPAEGEWEVNVKDSRIGQDFRDRCHVLINACGFLNAPKWPNIGGIANYQGTLVHTARWPDGLDLSGKRVGVIGNGPSGVQVAPAILPAVSKLHLYIREPVWIASIGSSHRKYSDEELDRFTQRPQDLTMLRKWLEHKANESFRMFLSQSGAQKKTREDLTKYMEEALRNHPAAQALIPNWPVGCRRLSPAHGYIDCIKDPKVQVVTEKIEAFTKAGIALSSGEHELDAVICATGFVTSFNPRFNVHANGKSLNYQWRSEPQSYFGMAAANFPNYFSLLGPNSPLGNGPVLVAIETQADYICKLIHRIQCENVKSITVKEDAVEDFIRHKDSFMQTTVWIKECRSWYKNETTNGKVTALWPGSTLHFIEALKEVRYEDFDISYFGNRFSYFGNGLSKIESQPDADLAPYIRAIDDSKIFGSRLTYRKKAKGF